MLVESLPFPEQVGLCASESRFKSPPIGHSLRVQVLELNGMVLADSQRRWILVEIGMRSFKTLAIWWDMQFGAL